MGIPGLPALPFGIIIETVVQVLSDVFLPMQSEQQWGLFLNGQPVVIADNVVSFEFKQDFRISNYPVEEGGFETYNKVAVPYDVRLRFSTGGSTADRQALLDSIDAIMPSLELFDAVTPEKVYTGLNPVHQDIRRTARDGVGLVVVDLFCEEIRVTASPQFTSSTTGSSSTPTAVTSGQGNITIRPVGGINSPQSASAAPQVSDGSVQALAPTPSQSASFADARGTGFDF